jgi:hypothetical protein
VKRLTIALDVESEQGIAANVADNTVRESIQQLGKELDWEAK